MGRLKGYTLWLNASYLASVQLRRHCAGFRCKAQTSSRSLPFELSLVWNDGRADHVLTAEMQCARVLRNFQSPPSSHTVSHEEAIGLRAERRQ